MSESSAEQCGSGRPWRRAAWLMVWVAAIGLWGLVACGPAIQPETAGELPKPSPVPPPPTAVGPAWFRDVTAESGLQFTYRNGEEADQYSILESLGGGVALIDYDLDGLLDVFVAGGGFFDGPDKKQLRGHPCKMYKNLGQCKFSDVSAELGLAEVAWWYTHGGAVADYDRDGWPDLVVTGYGRLALFHNEPGDNGSRRFVDVTKQLGLEDESWVTSAGWADLDGDGFPDLYACHYVDWSFDNHVFCPGISPGFAREICSPHSFKPLQHALYHNEQGQAFRNEAVEHRFQADGAGLGVVLADLNDDARPDIFVTNDMTPNFLFFNRGGKLEEKASLAGLAVDERGSVNGNMGVDVGDYDRSGRPSVWVTVFQNEQHVLGRNLGGEVFLPQSRAAGVGAIGQHFIAFGTAFFDVDNDGWEDLVLVNGHVYRHPPGGNCKQRPVLLQNIEFQERRFFQDKSGQGGPFFKSQAIGRGLAVGDLDNDGWPDLVVSHTNSPVAVLRNQAAQGQGTPHHWLGVQLAGREHRDVVGSTIILEGSNGVLTRFAKGGGSYLSAGDRRILFGLGDTEQIRRVTVKWSWGQTQTWDNLAPNRYWELTENEREAKVLTPSTPPTRSSE